MFGFIHALHAMNILGFAASTCCFTTRVVLTTSERLSHIFSLLLPVRLLLLKIQVHLLSLPVNNTAYKLCFPGHSEHLYCLSLAVSRLSRAVAPFLVVGSLQLPEIKRDYSEFPVEADSLVGRTMTRSTLMA